MVLFWIPAICDLTGTTASPSFRRVLLLIHPVQLMNVGLLYTPVSIYQMTRGALVLFVGTFSVLFLRRRLWFYQLVHSCA
jgi:drug/metabolite transporter (DMT)-like permease